MAATPVLFGHALGLEMSLSLSSYDGLRCLLYLASSDGSYVAASDIADLARKQQFQSLVRLDRTAS